ncbi:hypothetical protein LOTGIDRAFT_176752 [Lottia gigantea]|uniref:Apple domain-containing protein n=1 Tax=Lottia gigantea TaxID=225164 RepID=V4A878_LOTGI|nr:hypothetical protein LOTGIDRAFT_176752 [Lottia gigantea]ESO92917.1 hypothetical protein LOTGIDRAFT_176752 [Lottia gigantea]
MKSNTTVPRTVQGRTFALKEKKAVPEGIYARIIKEVFTRSQPICDTICEVIPGCGVALYDPTFVDCHLYQASRVLAAFLVQSSLDEDSSGSSSSGETKAGACQKECALNERCISFSFDEINPFPGSLCLLLAQDASAFTFLDSEIALFE